MRANPKDLLRQGEIVLKERGIENHRFDAFNIHFKHFKMSRAELLLAKEQELSDEGVLAFWQDIRARGDRKPLQHILGAWEFMGYEFMVSPHVLIPRAETEWLVEYAKEQYEGRPIKVLDLCTGSGCIGIALKKLLPQAQVTLIDISDPALAIAKENAKALEAEVKIEKWDVLQGPPFFMEKERFDLILCNPPYIKSADLATLQPEVRQEPELALDGGLDGLIYYHVLAEKWTALLKEGGEMILETGEDTGEGVRAIMAEALEGVILHHDLSDLPRYVTGKKKGEN